MVALKIYEHPKYLQSIRRIASELPVKTGRILITGATGLIGSCLADTFFCANRDFGCDFKIYALGLKRELLNQRFHKMESVICLAQNIMEPITDLQVDYIIHAASNADPKSYALYPAETILINILGAKNILEICKGNKTKVLFTSTFEVYGKLEQDEYGEDDYGLMDQNRIRSCYPESKRTAEILFRAYHEEYNVNSVIARLSSIYGPTMLKNDSKAHAQFLRNALNGDDIVLKSKGDQKRTYCYVMDAVSGLLTVLFGGAPGEVYNVTNKDSVTTIYEMATIIAELSGTKVVHSKPDSIEQKGFSKAQNCVLKTEKIEKLGWEAKYSLRAGLTETLEIMRDMIENEKAISGSVVSAD